MRSYNGVVIVARSFFVAVGIVMLFSVGDASAQSPGDNVEVMVCPAVSESSLTVTEPQSDSVINEPKVAIKGNVEYISQIDFFIDDVYNNTVALGYSATDFESSVTLSPGTHTIKFVATDSCFQTTHNNSLVITYQPKTQPSVGQEVETKVDDLIIHADDQATLQPEKNAIENTIDRFIAPPFLAIAESLTLTEPTAVDPTVRAENVTRSAAFVAGTALTLSAAYVSVSSVLPAPLSFLLKFRRRLVSVIGLGGLMLITLVFML